MAASNSGSLNAMSMVAQDTLSRIGMNVDHISADWDAVTQRRTSNLPTEKGG